MNLDDKKARKREQHIIISKWLLNEMQKCRQHMRHSVFKYGSAQEMGWMCKCTKKWCVVRKGIGE